MKDKLNSFTTKVSKTLFDTKMFLKNKGNKYPILFSLFGVVLSSLSVVGITFSLWTKTASTGNSSISSGTITMKYVEDTNVASLEISDPMTANQAYQSNSYYPFQVAMTASGNATLDYEITITTQNTTTLNYNTDEKVRIGLKKENVIVTDAGFNLDGSNNPVDYTNGIIVGTLPATGTNLNGNTQTVYKGTITSTGTETVHNFKLYLWLDSNAIVNDNDEKYVLTINVNTGDSNPSYGNYTLTYVDTVGSGCNPTTKEVRKRMPWGELCKPSGTVEYAFAGWYTGQNGTGTEVTSNTTATNDLTVYAHHNQNTLYTVLKNNVTDGIYAKRYTGSHQDSMNASLSTENIYYWYASSVNNAYDILDKNNVIFANHCWQMLRTTDTGGVRMIYNGEVVDGKCLNTRGTHIGYNGNRSTQSLNGTYWYGTDYTYDSNNNVFSISGTTSSTQVTSSNGSTIIPTLVGKYTCKSTSENGTCSILYLIESYNNSYYAYSIPLNSNSNYSQFGTLQFNGNNNSPAYVGYMYNTVYTSGGSIPTYYISQSLALNTNHYYSDTISYNGGQYTLTNPQLISSLSDTSDLVGKYMLGNGGNTSYTTARYIVGINGTTLSYRELTNGDLNTSMMIGDSYIDNGNGTYTVQSATPVTYIEWYNTSDFSPYRYKYVCDGTSATCSNVKHLAIYSLSKESYKYLSPERTYKYSESVSYNNGTYTLTGDIQSIWDLPLVSEQEKLATHHYTCLNNSTTCSTVNYVIMYYDGTFDYVRLTGVNNISEALTNMLSANDVNTKNSIIKTGIDAWYKKYMLPYDSYIEDTIYCNDRSIKSIGAWKEDGGIVNGSTVVSDSNPTSLQFKEYNNGTSDLSCNNITDKFSVSNSSAQLTYKVGLATYAEMNLLNNANVRKTDEYYWLLSPNDNNVGVHIGAIYANGNKLQQMASSALGVRPAISLKAGLKYSAGDGSMANPYVVDTSS